MGSEMCIRDRPGDTSDDLSTADFSCTPDLAGPIAPGDSVTCTATLQVSADTTNVANTSGNPTDADGNDLPGLADPTDADDAVVDLLMVSIGSVVFEDVNGDSLQDAGDNPIAGAVVTLLNADGSPATDADGNPVAPQTTGADAVSYTHLTLPTIYSV